MHITPKDLAALVGGKVEGDDNIELTGFAKIEEAKEGDLCFIANPKYAHYIQTTKAGAVLVRNDFEAEGRSDVTLIRVADPYETLAKLLQYVDSLKPSKKGVEQPSFIAEGIDIADDVYVGAFAYIGHGAKIGKNVKIYPQAYIGDGVTIGDDTIIRSGVKIYEGCVIGNRCIIHSGAVIGADGFGFAPNNGHYDKIPQMGIVIIEDDVEIGANTCVDRATFGNTFVGRGTKLDNLIQVGHNVTIGEDNVFAAQTGIAGSTHIGNHNMVGGQCGFAGHIKIGNDNQFGAQSGFPNDVDNGKKMIGSPAVDFLQFAKNQVYMRRLPEVFDKLKKLSTEK